MRCARCFRNEETVELETSESLRLVMEFSKQQCVIARQAAQMEELIRIKKRLIESQQKTLVFAAEFVRKHKVRIPHDTQMQIEIGKETVDWLERCVKEIETGR
jgi:hypothetical protein